MFIFQPHFLPLKIRYSRNGVLLFIVINRTFILRLFYILRFYLCNNEVTVCALSLISISFMPDLLGLFVK